MSSELLNVEGLGSTQEDEIVELSVVTVIHMVSMKLEGC